jgi:hypothetical protein
VPLEVEPKGVTLKIERQAELTKLERIRRMGRADVWVGDPNDIFHMDYLEEWREEWGLTKEETDVSDGEHEGDDGVGGNHGGAPLLPPIEDGIVNDGFGTEQNKDGADYAVNTVKGADCDVGGGTP